MSERNMSAFTQPLGLAFAEDGMARPVMNLFV